MKTVLGEIWADDTLNIVAVKVYYGGETHVITAAANLGLDTAIINALVDLTDGLVKEERGDRDEVDE
jgi:hypothetical protein